MRKKNSITKMLTGLLTLVLIAGIQVTSISQITTYQYRHVPDDKIEEFLKRETTYWSKVAQKAVDNKKLSFWAILEKIGGYDLPNSSNYLFINTFSNIDSSADIWNAAETIAGVKIDQMETNSLSKVTSQFFLHGEGWEQDSKAVPEKDFNYVVFVYHNTDYQDSLINLEKKYWGPFIKKAMDSDQTPQMGWGNAVVLAPMGENIKFNTVSYDLYKTLQDALMPNLDPKIVYPTQGLEMINKLEINRRGRSIYRVVKVVSAAN